MTEADQLSAILAKAKRNERLTKREQRIVDDARRPPSHYATMEDAAAHYGVSRPALYRWKEVFPEAFEPGPDGYDAKLIGEARKRFLAQGKGVRLNKGDVDGVNQANSDEIGQNQPIPEQYGTLEELKLKKEWLSCQKLATQIDILQSKYALIDDIMEQVRAVIYATREKFQRLAPEQSYEVSGVSPAEAEERLRVAVGRILTELADEDYNKIELALRKPPEELGDQANRMPAARDTNGRQRA